MKMPAQLVGIAVGKASAFGVGSWKPARPCWLTLGVPFKGLPHNKSENNGILRAGSIGIK